MTTPFVSTLRSRAEPIRMDTSGGTVEWTIRVQCAEVWDVVKAEVAPSSRVIDVKRAALTQLMPDAPDPAQYVVKLGGFAIQDEAQSIASAGVSNGSTLLITSIRRRPVR